MSMKEMNTATLLWTMSAPFQYPVQRPREERSYGTCLLRWALVMKRNDDGSSEACEIEARNRGAETGTGGRNRNRSDRSICQGSSWPRHTECACYFEGAVGASGDPCAK